MMTFEVNGVLRELFMGIWAFHLGIPVVKSQVAEPEGVQVEASAVQKVRKLFSVAHFGFVTWDFANWRF